MRIIGIIGRKESGKSTFAESLREDLQKKIPTEIVLRYSFATALKKIIEKAGICNHEELYEKKTDFSRMMMQKIGTEIVRTIDPDYWCKQMWSKLREAFYHEPNSTVIIDDVRFLNEVALLKSLSAEFVYITRPSSYTVKDSHASENIKGVIPINCWKIVNDSTLDHLNLKAQAFALFISKLQCDQSVALASHFTKERTKQWRSLNPRSRFSL